MKLKVVLLSVIMTVALNAGDMIVKSSKNSVDKTVQKIENILKKKGITLFAIVDYRKGAKSVGTDMTDAKLVIFGNPKLGTKIMQRDIRAGIELPMKVLVYRDFDGNTKIGYKEPKDIAKGYNLAGCGTLAKLSGAVDMITTKAGM